MPDGGRLAEDARAGGGGRDVTALARHWLDQYGTIALATVLSTAGSFPVPVGGQLLVGPDDRFEGSVSGGCVEAAVIAEAGTVMTGGTPKRLSYGVSDESAWQAGLPCGGTIEVFLARLRGPEDAAFLDAILDARAARVPLVAETGLESGRHRVHRDVSTFDAPLKGQLEASGVWVDAEGQRFLQAFVPPVRLILVGAGHIAQVLSDLAIRVGFQVTVVDPRTAFSSAERFAGVALRHDWPGEALAALGLDSLTAVVTLAHEARLDDETLTVALRSPCFYVGALGSRRTHEKRVARLEEAGLSSEEIARLDAPVGLNIGARGPAEIAVSILAVLIKARRGA